MAQYSRAERTGHLGKIAGQSPDPIHRDHKLLGNHVGRRDCHIESDWVLIYKIDHERIIFERMGTYSDLLKK